MMMPYVFMGLKRLANTSEMLKYVKSIADLDQINVAAKRLSDTPPRVVKKRIT